MHEIYIDISLNVSHEINESVSATKLVQCRYDAVNFLQNPHKRYPIARPGELGMGCRSWV